MSALDPLARKLINRLQGGFPLVERPFAQAAAALDTDEARFLACLETLIRDGWLSRFGPLYNAERLGGQQILAAMSVPVARFEEVAAQVNALAAVAHNYRREHALNMWFVVAAGLKEEVEAAIQGIERDTGLPVLRFPKLKEFYLGLKLEIDAEGRVTTSSLVESPTAPVFLPEARDLALIAATQGGLPLVAEPYAEVGRRIGLDAKEVMTRFQRLLASGGIRRLGVIPNHYRLGLRANAMSVWDLPDAEIERCGRLVGALDCVSHCYQRPRYPGLWPYNLFAMVHGPDRREVDAKLRQIAARLGDSCRAHEVLMSTAILKKEGLRLVA